MDCSGMKKKYEIDDIFKLLNKLYTYINNDIF